MKRPLCLLMGAFFLTLATAPPLAAQQGLDARYRACLELTGTATRFALNEAKLFLEDLGGWRAEHCAGLALLLLGQAEEAAPYLEQATKGAAGEPGPARAAIAALQGQAWSLAGDREKSLAAQDLAIFLDSSRPDYYVDRAFSLSAQEDYWSALDDLNAAHDIAPNDAQILTLRATLYRRLEVPELALENAEEAIALAPNLPEALLERAFAQGALGNLEAALDDLERLLTIAPDSPAAAQARALLERLS